MQYRAFEPFIEVNGQTVYAIVDGFQIVKRIPKQVLLDCGIGRRTVSGVAEIDRDAWYPQQAWLDAFSRIAEQMGPKVLHQIGRRIPENAIFPPSVVDIDSAIASIDVAYHLNHRRRGVVMFDLAAGTMLEGIGHYGCARPDPKERRIESVCANPYPCDFDLGIVTSMALKFERAATVAHAPGPCRKNGDDACTYVVTW